MHSNNSLKSVGLFSLLIFLAFSGCLDSKHKGLSFAPMPLLRGQYVEYVKDSFPYDSFHVKFSILNLNQKGMLLETDYVSFEETLKVKTFHHLEKNYLIDTFTVQFNSEIPFKFIPQNGNFIFESPISNLFMWAEQIDTTNWKTVIINNKNYNIFIISINKDTIFYCSEIPIFNIARMFVNNEHLQIYSYGNKGAVSLFTNDAEKVIMGNELPESFKKQLILDNFQK